MTHEIVKLVSVIQACVTTLVTHFESTGTALPSFNVEVPADLGIPPGLKDIEDARISALSACMELHDLLLGPRKLLTTITNPAALQAIYRFDIASKFPIGEEISYQELSEKCGLPEQDLRSIVRYAILHHRVFQEPRNGFVAHTNASKLLAENSHIRDMVGLTVEEWAPAYTKTVDALVQFPDRKPNQTGFALANNTDKSLYEFLSTDPARINRFAGAMKLLSADTGAQVRFLIDQYPWASLGSGKVVDVGGSKGHISVKLSEVFPTLSFIVQDLPDVVAGADQLIPSEVRDRFSFMDHDIFHEQPIPGDVYLLRYILHNWPDDECVRILRSLVPALRPGSKILINDHIIPGPGVLPLSTDKELRAMDLRMMTIQNARERELGEWENIIHRADSRLRIVRVKLMDHSLTGLLEVALTDKDQA